MKKFIVRRVLLGAMILFFVSMIIYSIERALPTSYVEGRARDMSMKQGAKPYDELVAELNASYGLDKPVLEGYFVWLGKAFHGEFGESWIFHQPVTKKFSSVIWYSFVLALASGMETDDGFDRRADALIEIDSQREKYKSDFEEFYDILKQEGVVHKFYMPVKMDTDIYQ